MGGEGFAGVSGYIGGGGVGGEIRTTDGVQCVSMEQSCKACGSSFAFTQEDAQLLQKMTPVIAGKEYPFSAPTHCFSCRNQRRWARRNHRKMYKRKDVDGEEILSLYSPDKPFTIYKEERWYGDSWDSLEYGRPYDPNKLFFEQFAALQQVVPRSAMHQDGTNENCEYTTFGGSNKNCYLTFGCMYCQDVYYSTTVGMSKNCMDCFKCVNGELLYQCIDCFQCYNCIHCLYSINCQDSLFLEDCRDCKHCIRCKNLRHKEYYIENKPVSPEEFEREKMRILSGDLSDVFEKFQQWKLQLPHAFARITQCEDCTGDYLDQVKHCIDCFEMALGGEDCRHCHFVGMKCKDLLDCTQGGQGSELLYESVGFSRSQRCISTCFCNACSETYYCDMVNSCEHCFGCIGISHKKYCILNTQYSQEEYETIVQRIIEKMIADGEWGEFFPVAISPFAYNETIAVEHYPLSKEEAIRRGYAWKEEESKERMQASYAGSFAIADVPDSISKEILVCDDCGNNYRIIPQELAAYRTQGIPLPRHCPECRHYQHMSLKNPPRLWERKCQKCEKEVQSSYSPDRAEIIYCEQCYLASLY